MTTTELILVRHGQTAANANHIIAGWTDVPLTERGKKQAAGIRSPLEQYAVDTVWSSDLVRTIDTGALAWGDTTTDPRIRELNFGDLEGQCWRDLESEHLLALKDFKRFEAPGGESITEFAERVHGFVDHLSAGRHLVFTHGGVMRLLLHDLGFDTFVGNCAVIHVNWTTRRIQSHREGSFS
jgi:2,3-bisphosphoglycerate-dependent phosphoglycerate mutase